MPDVIIDPGHGGHDVRGRSTPYGDRTGALWEKDLNLRLAERVATHLGGNAGLTRVDDHNLPLYDRAAIARRSGARAFVSLHGHGNRGGTKIYIHPRSGLESRALADSVQRELSAGHDCHSPPAMGELAVLHPEALGAGTAACLVECGYATGDVARGDTAAFDQLGAAIARGVHAFLGGGLGHGLGDAALPYADRAPMVARAFDLSLTAACDACLAVVAGAGFPANQTQRLSGLLAKIRTPSIDDRYVNGYDYLLRTLGPRLNDEQLTSYLNQNHVRADVIYAAQNPDTRRNMELLDSRILTGISWLNMKMYTQGGALSEAVLQIKDWVATRQHDQNSVYWCYGDGQDAYGARFGGARRRDSQSACG